MIDQRHWRVGSHYDIHLYAEGNIPIATAMTPEAALQIVYEHNLMCDFRRASFFPEQVVEIIPCPNCSSPMKHTVEIKHDIETTCPVCGVDYLIEKE